jgi:uncharacterized membrane protein YbhN (UPF0104 family)
MASSLLEKIVSVSAVALMGFVGALVMEATLLAEIAALVFLFTAAVIVWPRIIPWRLLLRFFGNGSDIDDVVLARCIRPRTRTLAGVLMASLAGWASTYTVLYFICLALSIPLSAWYVFSLAPIITLTRLVPFTSGGIGVTEYSMVWLFQGAGVGHEAATQAALLSLVLLTLTPGFMGLGVLSTGSWRRHTAVITPELEPAPIRQDPMDRRL